MTLRSWATTLYKKFVRELKIWLIPLRAKRVGEIIEIRHKKISPTRVLGTVVLSILTRWKWTEWLYWKLYFDTPLKRRIRGSQCTMSLIDSPNTGITNNLQRFSFFLQISHFWWLAEFIVFVAVYVTRFPYEKIVGNDLQYKGFQPVLFLLSGATCEDFWHFYHLQKVLKVFKVFKRCKAEMHFFFLVFFSFFLVFSFLIFSFVFIPFIWWSEDGFLYHWQT